MIEHFTVQPSTYHKNLFVDSHNLPLKQVSQDCYSHSNFRDKKLRLREMVISERPPASDCHPSALGFDVISCKWLFPNLFHLHPPKSRSWGLLTAAHCLWFCHQSFTNAIVFA